MILFSIFHNVIYSEKKNQVFVLSRVFMMQHRLYCMLTFNIRFSIYLIIHKHNFVYVNMTKGQKESFQMMSVVLTPIKMFHQHLPSS